MMEPYGFGFSREWLFPGWRPEDSLIPPEYRLENRDLRIPRRLDQIDMPGGFSGIPSERRRRRADLSAT